MQQTPSCPWITAALTQSITDMLYTPSLTAVLAQRLMSGVGVARRTPRRWAADNPTDVLAQQSDVWGWAWRAGRPGVGLHWWEEVVSFCCCSDPKSCLTLLQPHGLQPTRLLCPWDFPGRNTGAGCHARLWGIFPTQGSDPRLPHWQADYR